MDLYQQRHTRPAEPVSCHVYEDGHGRWRWETVDAIGAVIVRSNRGFDDRHECFADALKQGQPTPLSLVF
jgi:hypothetical protein